MQYIFKAITFSRDVVLRRQRFRSSAWSEHRTLNPGVAGSNPVGTIYKPASRPKNPRFFVCLILTNLRMIKSRRDHL